jgi:hypothetical protein
MESIFHVFLSPLPLIKKPGNCFYAIQVSKLGIFYVLDRWQWMVGYIARSHIRQYAKRKTTLVG